ASAEREGMRLISAVLNTRSTEARAQETQKLLNFGFRFYETQIIATPEQALATPTLWKGAQETLAIGVQQPLAITLGRNLFDEVKSEIQLDKPLLEAPVTAGTTLGTVRFTVEGKPVAEAPLVALESVESGSLWNNLVDSAKLWFQ
ncbi:MAG TPA: D-alanyl-D-alanine carboxypeptidase, partial [Gammaproteobacteria bacterium]|nr:D-alanyl-D-alanine carboxypeptidase [Gammaproteobacteria bacterium]